MKRRLQHMYWLAILITMAVAALAIAMLIYMKINDTREELRRTLNAVSAWTLASDESLQHMADSVAQTSPPLRVTYLMNHGLILADSLKDAQALESPRSRPEIVQAVDGMVGESLRLFETRDVFNLYVAKRISPQLILRLGYPIRELTGLLSWYSLGLILLFLVLFFLQRQMLSHFINACMRQLDDVRRLLEGDAVKPSAAFPEFQPALSNITYLVERINNDRQEILRTQNMRGDFVANASHELRSPLTSIMGFAEMLDEGLADTPEEQALCTQMIRSECGRMLDVINEILLLSRSERQELQNTAPVDVGKVAHEICQALAPQAAPKGIALSVEGDMTLDAVEKDIWEILYNLTDNAIRYGRQDGHVRILLGETSIAVEDDGIGIDKSHLPRIFEQFYRVDEARDVAARGTGLGLSIVRAIVQRYGGEMTVQSELGRGSRFTAAFRPEKEDA